MTRVAGWTALALVALVVVGHYVLAPQDPMRTDAANRLASPDRDHLLGTDDVGRDVWARLAAGAVGSLTVAVVAVALSSILGLAVGGAAGVASPAVDRAVTTAVDTLIAFPRFLLILNVAAVVAIGSPATLGVLIGATSWMRTARLVRTEVLSIRRRPFVEAAHSIGAAAPAVVARHVVPQVLGLVLEIARLRIASVILTAATLNFLGVGMQTDAPTWGSMIQSGQAFLTSAPWIALPVVAVLCLTSVGLVLAGERRPDLSRAGRRG